MPAVAVTNTVDCVNVTIAQRLRSLRIPAFASSFYSSLKISWTSRTGKRRRLADCTTRKMSQSSTRGPHTDGAAADHNVSNSESSQRRRKLSRCGHFVNAHTKEHGDHVSGLKDILSPDCPDAAPV